MTKNDVSRHLFQPRKHYTGARFQQGRVVLDSDFNEDADLDAELTRRALFDVIGPVGTPDDGFRSGLAVGDQVVVQPITFGSDATPSNVLNYRLHAGSLYLCGMRFEHEALSDEPQPNGDPIAFQRDFLQMGVGDAPLASPGQVHTQLSFVHAHVHSVSPVEDREFLERALGGASTSYRLRRNARVLVREVENGSSCQSAWNAVREQLENEYGGSFDAAGCELQSGARLQMTLVQGAAVDTCAPCGPDDAGRYLGADNQAVRIMLFDPPDGVGFEGTYVWAFDNASQIHRIKLERRDDEATGRVEFVTPPSDEAHWPLENTVVELLPWGALLENGEKPAERVGALFRVSRGFDPDDGSIELASSELPSLENFVRTWDAAHPGQAQLPNDADADGDYLYMRVWHRLDDEGDDLALAAGPAAGNHQLLARVGLRPVFTGTGKRGDYWTVTVRPNTPQQLVPWEVTRDGGIAPHGPRDFFAPATLVRWRPPEAGEHENTEVVDAVFDCRPKFRPLIDRVGCCTHTVGDGVTSHGDYASIAAAVEGLPEQGGTVCVLPGLYREQLTLTKSNVRIQGCGAQTRWVTPDAENLQDGLLEVRASNVVIAELTMLPVAQHGVLAGIVGNDELVVESLELCELEVTSSARDDSVGGQARSTINLRNCRNAMVRDCTLTMDGSVSDQAAVFLRGNGIRLESSRVETLPPTGNSIGTWGGVQIGGESKHVSVERNQIVGGSGHGVTLGSLVWVSENVGVVEELGEFDQLHLGPAVGYYEAFDPCAPKEPAATSFTANGVRYDPHSEGDLESINIVANRIEAMLGNGISVLTTLPLPEDGEPDLISVSHIIIERNRITGNVVDAQPQRKSSGKSGKSKGGDNPELFGQFTMTSIPPAAIALVDGEHVLIRDNDIHDNGVNEAHPVCGISIMYGDGIVIEGNRIARNGSKNPGSIPNCPAIMAAIGVSLAGVAKPSPDETSVDIFGTSLRIVGNIVEHPNGLALTARASGPMVVEGNHLSSRGNNASAQQSGAASCVLLTNLALPWEAVDLPSGEPSADRWDFPAQTPKYLQQESHGDPGDDVEDPVHQSLGMGGPVQFVHNHVILDWPESTDTTGLAGGLSVAVCAHDSVVMNGNQFCLNVADPGTKKKSGGATLNRPHLTSHVVVSGGTANVSHNRISEGVNDALMSLVVLGGLLVTSSYNTTTHASFAATCNSFHPNSSDPPSQIAGEVATRGNLVWLVPQSTDDGLVNRSTIVSAANQLFAALCVNCLGLDLPSASATLSDLEFKVNG